MVKRIWFALAVLCVVASASFAADVSGLATDTRFDTNDPTKHPTGIMSIPKNEIRRIPDMIDKPESQIGMWIPMVEPEPVVRGFDNRIKDNVRIYRNTGTTASKYPFLVKVVSGPDAGKWFVYRNVKYHWVFEDAGEGEHSGGVNGTSGGDVWTPFYKASGAEKAVNYMRNIVNGTGDRTWDPKVYPNAHKKPFDSGISGTDDTKGSTVLQEVGMTLTYERAEVAPTGVTGDGYYGNADNGVIDTNTISPAQLNSEPTNWESKKLINATPEKFGLKSDLGGFTAVNRVYVEDYSAPSVKSTDVKIYRGNAGGFVDSVYDKSTNSWKKVQGILFETEDDNPNAVVTSDRLKASMNYECGNMDLYKLDNPAYDPDDPTSEPYIYFVYLPPTYKMTWNGSSWERVKISDNPPVFDDTVVYGPYVGPAKKAEEYDYYKNIDPIWSRRSAEEVEDYITNRYANAYSAKSLAPWARGLCYFILDERNSGLLKIKTLNSHVTGKKDKDGRPIDVNPEIDAMINEYKEMGERGKKAAADLAAFKAHLAANGKTDYNRFSYIEFKDGGRYCVGPIEFEKIAGIYEEKNVTVDGQEVKQATWMIPGPRVLLPKHFAVNSIEWDSTAGTRHSGEQMATDSQNFVLGNDGKWHRVNTAADAGVPLELQVAGTNSNFINKYGHEWMQKVPDLMFKVDMADCCGNTTNQVGFLKVNDSGEGSKPNCECTLSDANGNDHVVGVPADDQLDYGDKLIVKDPRTGEVSEYAQASSLQDNDLTTKEISINKSGEGLQPPIGSSLLSGDKVIYEDTRLNIAAHAWDNIDNFHKHRGISYYKMQIQELDANGNPTGKYELLEDENGNKDEKIERSIFDPPYNGRLSQFKPDLKFYHIFRNPGLYRVEYTVRDVPFDSQPNEQRLFFRVKVLDLKSDNRTIEDHQRRQ
ncbi:MAG: hypothetical protein OZSIB_2370 [Candidatus Ozemobacter sibiricus]|uniref:Uncharacterized protein n=1 Tax=Candidatus Ozemobacter sibiricus TaxID=2268124 RepID=A0A367ZS75_9BACT|nr:MAG: hypothetical protein OZSIB_2370 [Candidatus Ozemobacter sibiricus]